MGSASLPQSYGATHQLREGKPANASASFLKKRSKKLLIVLAAVLRYGEPGLAKVFWFFFSKKNGFLSSPFATARRDG
jgi:hypothetical protein